MKTMKKIIWRLSNPPTALEIVEMVRNGILTQEEAKQMIIREEETEE